MKQHFSTTGLSVSLLYCVLVIFVYTYTATNTKPENVGYDWIPFILLAMPWYRINPRLLMPGLILNAGVFYLLGVLLPKVWRLILLKHRS